MLSPDETALVNLLGHPFFVRSRHFYTPTVVRFKMPLNATRSALVQVHRHNFSRLWHGLEQTSFK